MIMGYKIGGEYMPNNKRVGRPTDNPKTNPIHIRLDKETNEILEDYCIQECIPRTEGVRRGIRKLKDDIKK